MPVVKKISVWIQILFGKREKGKGEEESDFQQGGLNKATTCASLDTNESKPCSWLSGFGFLRRHEGKIEIAMNMFYVTLGNG